MPDMNRRFSVEPVESGSAFVGFGDADLDLIFSFVCKDRTVCADNTIKIKGLALQIEESPYRVSFARCKVDIYEHLDNSYSAIWKKRILGRYDAEGKPVNINSDKPGTSLHSPVPNFSINNYQTGHFTCYEKRTH